MKRQISQRVLDKSKKMKEKDKMMRNSMDQWLEEGKEKMEV